MRNIITGIILLLFSALLCVSYLPQPVLAVNGPQAIPTSAGVPPTRTTAARTPVINLGGYKLTQTALVLTQSTVTVTSSLTPIPTETAVNTATETTTTIPATATRPAKPQRLPNTGNVDQGDVWSSTAIIILISVCLLLGLGLYWQSRRVLK
jgi:hypothetical protein